MDLRTINQNPQGCEDKNLKTVEHEFPFKVEAIYGCSEQKDLGVIDEESDNNRRPQADLCFARLSGHKGDVQKGQDAQEREKLLILNRTAPCLPGKWVVFGCQGGLWLERILAISTDSITFASNPKFAVPNDQVDLLGVVARVQYLGFR